MKDKAGKSKTSFSCNPELLKHFRILKEMTQGDLADATGFSERLIGKAESGKPISMGTIKALANALSSPERELFAEDLIANPEALAREYVRCMYVFQQDSFERVRSFLHQEIVLHISGNPDTVPHAGIHNGLAEVKKAIGVFWSYFEVPNNHDHSPHYKYFSAGNEVLVWGESWIQPIGFPIETPIRVCYRISFKSGKIVRLDSLIDSEYAAAILQLANESTMTCS